MTRLFHEKPRQLSAGRSGGQSKHLLNATGGSLLRRLSPVEMWGDAGTLEYLNLWPDPLPRLRSKHSDLHEIAQVVQTRMVGTSNVWAKAENSSL